MNKIKILGFLLIAFNATPLSWAEKSSTHPISNARKEVHLAIRKGEQSASLVQRFLNDFTLDHVRAFSKLYFIKREPETQPSSQKNDDPSRYKNFMHVFYNQQGYDEGVQFPGEGKSARTGNEISIGSPLTTEDHHPIGYNIFIPKKISPASIRAVVVRVYGGLPTSYRKQKMFRPDDPALIPLLEKGIAVVTLNLSDFIDLKTNQHLMPKDLFERIQKEINVFYETITFHPEKLHPNLIFLKNKPLFLYGESFGGGMSFRQAELYPGTYKGYISHNGAIGKSFGKANSMADSYNDYLSPEKIEDIKKITDRVLLLHSLDDNRVPLPSQDVWFQNAIKAGKESLVRVMITETGNPMVQGETDLKGHGVPLTPQDQAYYFDTIEKFIDDTINNVPLALPALSQWRMTRAVNTYKGNAMVVSENKQDPNSVNSRFQADIRSYFIEISTSLYYKYRLDNLAKNTPLVQIVSTPNKQDQMTFWQQEYLPLLYILDSLKRFGVSMGAEEPEYHQIMDKLSNKTLSAKNLENALNSFLILYLDYLKENQFGAPHQEGNRDFLASDIPELAANPLVQKKFKEILIQSLNPSMFLDIDSTALALLWHLFVSNPGLFQQMIGAEHYQQLKAKWSSQEVALLEQFLKKINSRKALTQKVFRQAVVAAKTKVAVK